MVKSIIKKMISTIVVACIATIIYVYCLSKIDIFDKNAIAYATSEDAESSNEREIARYVEMCQNSTLSIDTPENGRWPYQIIKRSERRSVLTEHYPTYNWESAKAVYSNSVANLTKRNPVNVNAFYSGDDERDEYGKIMEEFDFQQKVFTEEDINNGLKQAKEVDSSITSSYGGCGAIAQIGMWHYFSSVLGYDNISNGDPYSSENKQMLAKEVFLNVKTSDLGSNNRTITLPSDYVDGFNAIAQKYNIPIRASYSFAGVVSQMPFFMEKIKSYIDNGIPVTICTGTFNINSDGYEGHCFNVCSYEKWVGIEPETNERMEYILYGTKANYGDTFGIRYMSEEVLSQNFVGLIWYDIQYNNTQTITASAFANDFVNESGQGQYYFYEKVADILLPNGYSFKTRRLRCSYIENKYLVLSANRKSNTGNYDGKAYLDFSFFNNVKKIEFDIARWGSNEGFTGLNNEQIIIECSHDRNSWEIRKALSPQSVTTFRDNPQRITVLLNAGEHVRISVKTTPTSENRNKGRIILDNITIYY